MPRSRVTAGRARARARPAIGGVTVTMADEALEVSLLASMSPVVLTIAAFRIEPVAPAATLTWRSTVLEAPAAVGPGLTQLTSWPAAVQLQPVPPAEMKVSDAGNVSVTVIEAKLAGGAGV